MKQKKKMNKKQLFVMWVGILLICAILVFPEYQRKISSVGGEQTQGYWEYTISQKTVYVIAGIAVFGLLVTLRAVKER